MSRATDVRPLRPSLTWLAVVALAAAAACGPPPGAAPAAMAPRPPQPEPLETVTLDRAERAWLLAVHERIHERWRDARARLVATVPAAAALEAEVAFRLDPRGRSIGLVIVRPSGEPRFDLAALDAVAEAGTLAPAPPSARSDDGYTRLRWRFSGGREGCSPLAARVQRDLYPVEQAMPLLVATGRAAEARDRLAEALALDVDDGAAVSAYARALLRARLADGDAATRPIAVLSLAAAGERAARRELPALLAPGSPFAARAVTVLGRSGRPDLGEHLLPVVRRNDGEASVAAAAVLAAQGHGAQVVGALAPALAAAGPATRARAARALCGLRHPAARAALVAIAADATLDPEVRVRAIDGLAALGGEEPARALARQVASADPQVRAAALVALGRTRRLRVRTRMLAIDHLRDPAPTVRAAAAATLIRVATGPGEWRGPFASVLRAGDARSGLAAVDSLAALGDGYAMRALATLAGHPHAAVRAAALARLNGGRTGAAVPDPAPRPAPATAADAASNRGHALALALGSPDLGTACVAAQRAAATADRYALRALVTRLGDADPLVGTTLAAAVVAGPGFQCPAPRTASPALVATVPVAPLP